MKHSQVRIHGIKLSSEFSCSVQRVWNIANFSRDVSIKQLNSRVRETTKDLYTALSKKKKKKRMKDEKKVRVQVLGSLCLYQLGARG